MLWRGYAKLQSLVQGALLHEQMQRQRQSAVIPHVADDPDEPP